jgi:hypothetical protein
MLYFYKKYKFITNYYIEIFWLNFFVFRWIFLAERLNLSLELSDNFDKQVEFYVEYFSYSQKDKFFYPNLLNI